jgi:chaperonin GroES
MARVMVVPRWDQVLIRKIEDDKSEGGLILPPSKNGSLVAAKGEVLAVGPGSLNDDFRRKPVEGIAVGSKVYFHTYPQGVEVDLGDHKVGYLIAERQVVGVIAEGK